LIAMRVGELLQTHVTTSEGRSLGRVRDILVVQDGPLRASGEHAFRVHGLVAGRFARGTCLGYVSRPGVDPDQETRGPLPIRALFRWLHRNAVYVPWQQIVEITPDAIIVEPPESRTTR
jgi:sporulation protein YlmC with PRC-barrel domain